MADRLARAGFRVRGYDVDVAARETFGAGGRGRTVTADAAACADGAEVVVLMLPSSAVVLDVALERGLLVALPPGGLLVDMGSSEPTATRLLAERAAERGTYPSMKGRLMLQYAAYGEPDAEQALDYYVYVLRSDEHTVVVDTGFAASVGEGRGRMCLRDPVAVLAPLDAGALILTHLHHDHIGNLEALGDAQVLAPATELAFWRSPVARHAPFWSHTDPAGLDALAAAEAAGRVRPFSGTATLAPGITAFEVGDHSPGQAMLLVRTADRPVLLCSDAVHLYEELALRRPFAVVDDLRRMYASFDLVDALVDGLGAVAVPGHDPLVMERFPEGRLGVRLG